MAVFGFIVIVAPAGHLNLVSSVGKCTSTGMAQGIRASRKATTVMSQVRVFRAPPIIYKQWSSTASGFCRCQCLRAVSSHLTSVAPGMVELACNNIPRQLIVRRLHVWTTLKWHEVHAPCRKTPVHFRVLCHHTTHASVVRPSATLLVLSGSPRCVCWRHESCIKRRRVHRCWCAQLWPLTLALDFASAVLDCGGCRRPRRQHRIMSPGNSMP